MIMGICISEGFSYSSSQVICITKTTPDSLELKLEGIRRNRRLCSRWNLRSSYTVNGFRRCSLTFREILGSNTNEKKSMV